MPDVLCSPGDHVDSCQAETGGRVNEEGSLGLIGLDQGYGQVRSHDLQRQPGQATAGSDIDEASRRDKVIEQDQRVLDELARWPRDETRPRVDQPHEFGELRIVH